MKLVMIIDESNKNSSMSKSQATYRAKLRTENMLPWPNRQLCSLPGH